MKNILLLSKKGSAARISSLLALVIILLNFTSLVAQDMQVSGVILSEENEPLPGVAIIIQGTSTGAVSDFDGKYKLSAASTDVLEYSFVGYLKQMETVGSRSTIDITMVPDTKQLEEIIVVGYGTRKKSHNTGAIAQVGGKDVTAVQANRVDDALAGKLSGVFIQNQSGEPGADPKIQIRAASSITGNSDPLIVVDGYPISGNLATVNPNDIESIEVLKDAASAAIYGSRGANGVIMVTLKHGEAGKTKFSYNSYYSISNKYVDNINMTAGEFADHADAQIASGNWDVSELEAAAPGYVDYKIDAFRNSPDVVAIEDHVFRTGKTQSHNFSMSGGSENANFFASIGYQDTEGAVIKQGFKRVNARLGIDTKLAEKFKAGLNFNGFTSERSALEHDMRDILRGSSIHPIYHTDASIAFVQGLEAQHQALGLRVSRQGGVNGYRSFDDRAVGGIERQSIFDLQPGDPAWDWHYGRDGNGIGGSSNPGTASLIDSKGNTEKTYFGNLSTYLEYNIIDGLNIKTVLGGDMRNVVQDNHYLRDGDNNAELKDTYLNQTELTYTSVLSETTLNYSKVIGNHDISALAGTEFQNFYVKGTTVNGNNVRQLTGDPLNFAMLEPADITSSERDETIARRSIFGRINYAYNDRYLASVSIRRDGDSRFGTNNKYEVFPALSLGWNVHNESFYNLDFLSNLKLRFSTGSLGTTSNLGAYSSLSILNPTPSVFGVANAIPNDVKNDDLTWQTNTETNFGISLGFLSNRFTLGVDYYTSNIENILIDQSVSEVFGTSSIRLNSGDVKSSGIEFELGAVLVEKDDFTWNASANLSTVNTEITDLGELTQLPDVIYGTSGRGAVYRNYIGGEIGELWALETTGAAEESFMINPVDVIGASSGEVYVVDQNGDGVIDATKSVADGGDLVKVGTNTPDFYWGMTHNFTYKSFDVGIQLQGSHGGVVYNVDPLYNGSNWGGRLRSSFDSEGDGIADHNGLHYTRVRDQTDAVIQDAGFIALRNVTFGYTLNSELVSKIGLGSVRVYAAASNLLYIMGDDYTSYNPEGVDTSSNGYQGPTTYGHQSGESPILRTFTFGLNVNF